MRRVVLLEVVHDERHRQHRVEFYPYVLGLADRVGWAAEWWAVPTRWTLMHRGGRYTFDLPADGRARLLDALAAAPPDLIVVHDRPADELATALCAAAPAARLVDLTRTRAEGNPPDPAADVATGLSWEMTVEDALRVLRSGEGRGEGAAPPELAGRALLDAVVPRYERRFLCAVGEVPPPQPLRLQAPPICSYRRPLRTNRFYRDLPPDALGSAAAGCAFCSTGHDLPVGAACPSPVASALLQVAAHQRATPPGPTPLEYTVETSPLGDRLVEFLAGVCDRGLRPSVFFSMPRADWMLAQRRALEELLPRMAAAGHRWQIISLGGENFSDDENDRFNKGVHAADLWACFELVRDLETRFPTAFSSGDPGYFAGILFTPWTRPDDLRTNLAAARRLGPAWLAKVVGIRLQLRPAAPITALARHDGLLADAFAGSLAEVVPVSITSPSERELPWRFADPRAARLHELLIRLEPISGKTTLAPGDPLVAELRAHRSALPPAFAGDHVAVAAALVEAVDALGAEADVPALFRHVAESAEARAALCQRAGPPSAVPAGATQDAGLAADGDPDEPVVLAFHVRPRGDTHDPERLFVGPYREGQSHFRRAGALVFWYGSEGLTERSRRFAHLLLGAMRAPGAPPPTRGTVRRWRAVLSALLERAGLADAFEWDVGVAPPAGPPR